MSTMSGSIENISKYISESIRRHLEDAILDAIKKDVEPKLRDIAINLSKQIILRTVETQLNSAELVDKLDVVIIFDSTDHTAFKTDLKPKQEHTAK